MRQKLTFFSLLLFVFALSACSDDDSVEKISPESQLTKAVKEDFDTRYADAKIKRVHTSSTGVFEIVFTDQDGNEGEIQYKNNQFEADRIAIPSLNLLPTEVLKTLSSITEGEISNLDIRKIRRSYISHDLYLVYFTKPAPEYSNLSHMMLLNEDGTNLYFANNKSINDFVLLVENYLTEFDYVKQHYEGSEILCQVNISSIGTLIIRHEGYMKFVSFGSSSTSSSWTETKYEVPLDYPVPTTILNKLKQDHPEFVYTGITKIETPNGNSYFLHNYSSEDGVIGYTYGE